MKLYTEEQVKEAIKDAYLSGIERPIDFGIVNDSIIKSLTPIELPSDEDINERSYINEKNMNIKLLIENHFGGTCPDDWDSNPEYKCTLSDIKQILEKIFNGFNNIDENGADWNIWHNLKFFEKKEQSIWKTQSNLREIMLKVDLSKKERIQLEFIANQERNRV